MKLDLARRFVLKFKQSSGVFSKLIYLTEVLLSKFFPLKNQSGVIRRFIAINGLKDVKTSEVKENLPQIEVFLPSTLKDLDVLTYAIKSCHSNSLNPISRISIAVPEHEVQEFKEALIPLGDLNIQIENETNLIGARTVRKIRETFGSRSGWVIAEFLKLNFVVKSDSPGVLVLDSDTILLQPQLWLDADGKQPIFPVQERENVYFDLLEKLGIEMEGVKYSFMSHYMLIQPEIYKSMFTEMANSDEELLLEKIITNRDPASKSPFCICFEAYAHFGLAKFAERFLFSKWSNFGIKRNIFLNNPELTIEYFSKSRMKSLSVHAYL